MGTRLVLSRFLKQWFINFNDSDRRIALLFQSKNVNIFIKAYKELILTLDCVLLPTFYLLSKYASLRQTHGRTILCKYTSTSQTWNNNRQNQNLIWNLNFLWVINPLIMLTIERAIRNEGKCKYFYNMIVGNKNFSNRVVLDLSRTAGLCTTFAFRGKYALKNIIFC